MATYTDGDFFGELSFLKEITRKAKVIAKTDTKILSLSKELAERAYLHKIE